MAVETTPLGFKAPDGNELVRNGDNAIADNARKAQELIAADRGRLSAIESKNTAQDTRLTNAESKNNQQDGRLTNAETRLSNAETAATTLTGRVTATENKNTVQDTRLTAAENAATTLTSRVTATESKNTQQDTTLASHGTRLTAAETAATTLTSRVTATESKNTAQDAAITAAQTAANNYADTQVAADRSRLSSIESKNTTQDGRLTSIEGAATTLTGRVTTNETGLASATGRVDNIETAAVTDDHVAGKNPRVLRPVTSPDYTTPFTDKDGYVSGGVQGDGVWNFERNPRLKGQPTATTRTINSPTTGWAIPFVDRDGRVAGGIRPDGTAEFFKLVLPPSLVADPIGDANTAAGYTRSSRFNVTAVGDSLTNGYFGGTANNTADAYPAKLQALMPAGVTVLNVGTSGFTVDEEAVRIGAIPLPLTVEGGSIPASGGVTVTTTAVIGWRPSGTVRNIPGTLAGIPGTLNRNTSDTSFTFTRTTAGTATAVPAGTLYAPDYAGHGSDTILLLLGRNNVSYSVKSTDATVADHVVKGIGRIVEWMAPQVKHVLVISNTTTTAETAGTAGYNTVADINTQLAAKYTTRFLNLRAYLVQQAIHDLGITPTAADTTAMNGDTLPPSIMDDNTHWSKPTAVLVAAQINNYLTTRGWV